LESWDVAQSKEIAREASTGTIKLTKWFSNVDLGQEKSRIELLMSKANVFLHWGCSQEWLEDWLGFSSGSS
jgi:hypothetical protein